MGSLRQCLHRLPHIGYLLPKSGAIHLRSDGVQERDSKCKGPGVEHGFGKVTRKGLTDGMVA